MHAPTARSSSGTSSAGERPAESRPNVAIARPGGGPGSALPLNDGWALQPALAESLLPFYERRELAFLPFAGTEDTSRSHFETQNGIELAFSVQGDYSYESGHAAATSLSGKDCPHAVFCTSDAMAMGILDVCRADFPQRRAGRSLRRWWRHRAGGRGLRTGGRGQARLRDEFAHTGSQ